MRLPHITMDFYFDNKDKAKGSVIELVEKGEKITLNVEVSAYTYNEDRTDPLRLRLPRGAFKVVVQKNADGKPEVISFGGMRKRRELLLSILGNDIDTYKFCIGKFDEMLSEGAEYFINAGMGQDSLATYHGYSRGFIRENEAYGHMTLCTMLNKTKGNEPYICKGFAIHNRNKNGKWPKKGKYEVIRKAA